MKSTLLLWLILYVSIDLVESGKLNQYKLASFSKWLVQQTSLRVCRKAREGN